METNWKLVEQEKPETGIEKLGYNKEWEDPDYNPDGICVCWLAEEGHWYVAKWCGQCDEWHTRPTGIDNWQSNRFEHVMEAPTHWMDKPLKPII